MVEIQVQYGLWVDFEPKTKGIECGINPNFKPRAQFGCGSNSSSKAIGFKPEFGCGIKSKSQSLSKSGEFEFKFESESKSKSKSKFKFKSKSGQVLVPDRIKSKSVV